MLYRGIVDLINDMDQIGLTTEAFTLESSNDQDAQWAAGILFALFISKRSNAKRIGKISLLRVDLKGESFRDPKEKHTEIRSQNFNNEFLTRGPNYDL